MSSWDRGKDAGVSTDTILRPNYWDDAPPTDTFAAASVENAARPTVLVVDDNEANRAILGDQLELMGLGYALAENGAEALEFIRRNPPDLILLDLMMPVMDGHALLDILQSDEALRAMAVIVISGKDDERSVVDCIEHGAVDYIVKPFRPKVLRARVENSLARVALAKKEAQLRQMISDYNRELEAEVARQVRLVAQAHVSTIFALSALAESRDPETGDHLDRMRIYCRLLSVALAQQNEKYADQITDLFAERIFAASPLHDIGKVAIPDAVLLKPGKLEPDEFDIMKEHCEYGARTLRAVLEEFPENELIQMGIEIAMGHHEKWDGSGYPEGVAGLEIPLSCRIVALSDVYDALTSKRCYKPAFTHEKSRDIILEGRGHHFDPDVVDAFMLCERQFNAIRARLQPISVS